MKKISLLIVFFVGFCSISAQSKYNWLKVGLHAGLPTAKVDAVSNFALGIDIKYQFLNNKSFGVGLATGYTNYFAKEMKEYENKDFGVIPAAALFRYYPSKSFFLGVDLGYGFEIGGENKFVYTSRDKKEKLSGGFYYRPEAGYHSDNWNIFAYYTGISSDLSPSNFGLGVNYNFILK